MSIESRAFNSPKPFMWVELPPSIQSRTKKDFFRNIPHIPMDTLLFLKAEDSFDLRTEFMRQSLAFTNDFPAPCFIDQRGAIYPAVGITITRPTFLHNDTNLRTGVALLFSKHKDLSKVEYVKLREKFINDVNRHFESAGLSTFPNNS